MPAMIPALVLADCYAALYIWPASRTRNSACCPPPCPVPGIKPLKSSSGGRELMRVLLSDGTHSHCGLLTTPLSALVASGGLRQGAIVRLQDWVANVVKGHK